MRVSAATRFLAAIVVIVLTISCSSGSGGVTQGAPGPTTLPTVTTTTGQSASSAKEITTFSFASLGADGTISETTHAIAVTVPFGTSVTNLVATFVTTGTSVKVGNTVQISGVTANNFTNPVVYTVTAADGTTVSYTVTVTVSPSNKAILTFELAGVSGIINETAKTISIVLPPDGTDITILAAVFTVSSGATVKVGTTTQTSGVTQNDYTNPIVYTVVASDNTSATYTVSVSILTAPKLISAFSVTTSPQAVVTLNNTAKTIAIDIPYNPVGPFRTSLIPLFDTSPGAIVKVGSTVQVSGVTANDFSNPVVYTVTAPDGLTVNYTVTVSYLPPRFTAFSFPSISADGVIDSNAKAVAVFVPARTIVTAMVSSFTVTNTLAVYVGSTAQSSGVTANDFTSPVVYALIDGTTVTQNHTVTVTKAPGLLNLPRTGQTTSFGTSPTSDDGTLRKGVPWLSSRFTPSTGYVTDFLTGLLCGRDGSTPTVVGCTGGVLNWQNALAYVACLNSNSFLGQTDWRLPNAFELMSLLTASVPNVNSWLNTQGFSNMQGNFYYSSTSDPVIPTQARIVNMVTGNSVFGSKTSLLNVLPVRGTSTGRAPVPQTGQTTCYNAGGATVPCAGTGQDGELQAGIAWPGIRFTNPSGTSPIAGSLVVDQLTGLMWSTDGDTPNSSTCPASGTWQGAFDYIACLNTNVYLGYRDWRLPNINELLSLVNASQADTSSWLNSLGFTNVQGNAYWSSTTDATVTDNAWVVFMVSGDKDSTLKTNASSGSIRAWPVRSGY